MRAYRDAAPLPRPAVVRGALGGLGQRVVADSFVTLATRIGNILLAAALGILVSRALGPSGRAIYQIPSIIAGLVTAGLGGLTTATCYAMLNEHRGRGAVRAGLISSLIFVGGGLLVVVFAGYIMHAPWAIAPAAIALPSAALVNVAIGYWYGMSNVRYANLLIFAATFAVAVAMVIGFIALGPTPEHAIAMWLSGSTAIAIVAGAAMMVHSRRLPDDRVALWPFLVYASKIALISVISILNYRVDVYIVAILLPPAELGLYTVAVTAAESLTAVTQIGASVTLPYIAALSRREAAELTGRCSRISVALALIMAACVWIVAPYLIVALYGPAFRDAVPPLRALLGGPIALAGASVISSFFTLNRGQTRVPFAISLIMALSAALLTLLLVPGFGLVGAGVATTLSYTLGLIIVSIVFSAAGDGNLWTLVLLRPSDVRSVLRHIRPYVLRAFAFRDRDVSAS